ncbi:MAG TPA: PA14 domain-containing protein [Thermoanaerobaculia bacterium]
MFLRSPAARLVSSLLFLCVLPLTAATLPTGFTETQVASGLDSPTSMAFAPDGRLFVTEQGGTLRVIENGALLPAPFLTVTVDSSGERGLLGVTFDPDFANSLYVYVYYTATTPTVHNRVSRFTASGDTAVAGSETVLLDLDDLSQADYHNGGALHFGPNRELYIAVGENGNSANSQTLGNLLGKILRINQDGSIPSDNPFFGSATGNNRAIWALGLRNPFTFNFQPGTGRMFINDVGQSTWEEIDDGIAGSNYGWPTTEGPTTDPRFRGPLYWYGHGPGDTVGCAITGGAFYNPASPQFPADYQGTWFFADYCNGWIRRYDPATNTASAFATGVSAPVDLRVADDGSLYYLDRGVNAVYRIFYTGSPAPAITTQPANRTVTVGQSATFTAAASGTAPLSYQWRRNGVAIPGATAASYTLPSAQAPDNGASFDVGVTNGYGNATSNAAILTVTANSAPTATITAPANNSLYSAGDTFTYSGAGTDAEDGNLPPSAFTWQVDFHHDTHIHPFIPATSGVTGGSFTIPTAGETSANVWYRILLTVRDSGGLTSSTYVDVVPRKVNLSLATNPSGLQVTLDGQPVTAPSSVQGVVGITRALGVVSPQTVGGITYQLVSWSDGGAATHSISTPTSDTIYAATFQVAGGGLSATYFSNMDLTGTTVTRTDPNIDFDWEYGSPVAGIGINNFSARWTGKLIPKVSGTHTLYTTSDDGVRLWINGVLVVDNWTDHAPTENSGTISLTAGQSYDLKMEYYENIGGAVAQLSWSAPGLAKEVVPTSQLFPSGSAPPPPPPPPPSTNGVSASYFNSMDLTGTPLTRTDPSIDFDWGDGSPAAGIGVNNFSARWTGKITPKVSGSHTFYTESDDGVRLWINGVLVVDNWTDHVPTENSGTISLTPGQSYDLRMEFYENAGGAVAQLSWSAPGLAREVVPTTQLSPGGGTPPPPPPPSSMAGLAASYFNSMNLTGTPLTRVDPNIDFDWGYGSPTAGIGVNNFSARWTGKITPKVTGTHTFITASDDGVRLWVNGVLLIDNWTDHPPTENSNTLYLTAGQAYDIKMEFYENIGGALAQLSWSAPGLAREIVPPAQLTH